MKTDRDVTRIVRSWLEEGATALPDRVLDGVLDQLPATPQRRAGWPARRLREMNNPIRIAVAAAAVLAVAVVGSFLLPKQGGVGGPGPTSSPIASAVVLPIGSAIAAGTYVMTPFAGPVGLCMSPPQPGCIEPAADNARAQSIRVTLTVPDGWYAPEGSIWLAGKDFSAPDGAGLLIIRGSWLLTDPCQNGQDPDIPVGPTADDFANALAAHPLLAVTAPVDVTLGGYRGKYMDLQVPADISKCAQYRPWEPGGVYAQGPSNRFHLWIIDVNGIRLVVQAVDFAATSAQHQAELRAIAESIQIQP